MTKILEAPVCSLLEFAGILFDQGKSVRLTVTGSSMQPFLRPHIDSVELVQLDLSTVKTGDIALFRRGNGEFVLHRIYSIQENHYFFTGDAQTFIEGPIEANQIIARVTTIWRGQKNISASNTALRVAAKTWSYTIFPRKVINYLRRKLSAAQTN